MHGEAVAVLYAGSSARCALAETVFHDVPDDLAAPVQVPEGRLAPQRLSVLTCTHDLTMADFTDGALPALGATRDELIGTAGPHYPATAAWGAAVHGHRQSFDGIVWNSRRSPGEVSFLLFGDRVNRRALVVAEPPLPLGAAARGRRPGYDLVAELAAAMNVDIVG